MSDPKDPGRRAETPEPDDRAAAAAADAVVDEDDVDPDLVSHLERGWDLLERGDLDGAAAAAEEAGKRDAEAPEVATLIGAIAGARGDLDTALASFERAIGQDPDFVDPYLHAADLYLYAADDPEEAIRLCDEALDVAEEEEEYLDALLLKAEAQIEAEDERGAARTLEELPPARLPEPAFELRAGRLFLDLGDLEAAEQHLQEALGSDPSLTDALHTLGLVYEERGDDKRMVQTFMKVREADLAEPAPPWGVSRERFEELAEEALGELPERIRELLANVPILAADYPALELIAEGNDPRMMGFFSGVPYPEKASMGGTPPHLDCVFLYQRNIERMCRTPDEVEEEIRKTLLHETGHFFGLSEEELEEMGLG